LASLKADLVGHEETFLAVKTLLKSGLTAGSFLFTGPEGVGKKKLAISLIQDAACESGRGCGFCGTCLRIEKLSFEGLLLIEPTQNLIKIEEAQKIKEFLRLRSLSNQRFILIDDAHFLNIPASNSLLKLLEEPPPGTFIFMISSQPRALLSTIRSRCRAFRVGYLRPEQMRIILDRHQWRTQNFVQRGQINTIQKIFENPQDATFELSFEILESMLIADGLFDSTEWRAQIKDKLIFQQVVFNCQLIIRDVLVHRWKPNSEELLLGDFSQHLAKFEIYTVEKIFSVYEKLIAISENFKWSPDPVFVIEKIAYDLKERQTRP
jgi:DNA polymerase III subunit delta'